MMAGGGGGTKVVQITNIAPQATKDQMQNLFGNIGKIDEIRLYPTIRDVSCPVYSRICYIKYVESSCVAVAQHMTNTVFIDRALIVCAVLSGHIPDEYKALEMTNNGTTVPGLHTPDSNLPPEVVNRIDGIHPHQFVTTADPKLDEYELPPYPKLPANYDARKIEEIRRTIIVLDIQPGWQLDDLMEHFARAGEVKYARFAELGRSKFALIEFCEQKSIVNALKLQGSEYLGDTLNIYHSTQAITKPEAKSNEAAQREIEEAMCIVKEAQNMISAAIDPVIGMLNKDKNSTSRRRSRSRSRRRSHSRSKRSKSRSKRSRSRSKRSRSRSKGSRSRKRSRSKARARRTRSRSKKRSRSRSKRSSPSRTKRSKSRSRKRSKSRTKRSKSRSKRSKSVSKRADSRSKRSRSKSTRSKRSRSKDRRKRTRSPRRKSISRSPILRRRSSHSRSRDRHRSHRSSKDEKIHRRTRTRSKSKRRSYSKGRSSRPKDSTTSSSRSSTKRRSRTPDTKKIKRISEEKVTRDYDAEEKIGLEETFRPPEPIEKSTSPEKSDNMDISNSP